MLGHILSVLFNLYIYKKKKIGKLPQTLKQNTEPAGSSGGDVQKNAESRKKESVSTQTQTPVSRSMRFNHQDNPNLSVTLVRSFFWR